MKHVKGMGVVSSDGRVLGERPAECVHTLQRQLAQAREQRDTALAALGEVQAAAAELMAAAADALLRERDNYRAACAAAAALCKKENGS